MKPSNPVRFSVFLIALGHLLERTCAFPCKFGNGPNSPWRFCDCKPKTGELNSGEVFCRHVAWHVVPEMPPMPNSMPITGSPDDLPRHAYRILALKVVESGLAMLRGDGFGNQTIHLLDFTKNQIGNVNVNSFRGLENHLYQLSLNFNSLNRVPNHALTYLYQLKYLHLQHNRIDEITQFTFRQTHLKNLLFLHLDHNLIGAVPEGAFSKLKLHILSLGSNRINHIESDAFPETLRDLDLKNNALNSIPYSSISNLPKLERLDLQGNNITTVRPRPGQIFNTSFDLMLSNNRIDYLGENAFGSFQKLKHLDLSYNLLKKLPESFLRGVKSILELDLSYNQLSTIPDGAFDSVSDSLRKLVLMENGLHMLPRALRALTSLESINLNANKLVSLDSKSFIGFKDSLKQLQLGFNELKTVPSEILQGMTKLRYLDLSQNQIQVLPPTAFGDFKGAATSLYRVKLDLSHNELTELNAQAFSKLEGIEHLFLQNNKLTTLPTEALKNLHKLRYLKIDNNKIMTIPNNGLQTLVQLEQLSISRNSLFAITNEAFSSDVLTNLKVVDASYNKIFYVSSKAFSDLTSLKYVNLDNNFITQIHAYAFHNLSALRGISLNRNKINQTYERSFSNLPNLEWIRFSHNHLAEIDLRAFSTVPNLEELDLSFNKLKQFNSDFLKGTRALRALDLSHNALSGLTLNRFRWSLEKLKLSYNRIQVVQEGMISGFKLMTDVDLSYNGIVEIEKQAFNEMPKLSTLKLNANYLSQFQKGTFVQQESYNLIDLSRNSIQTLQADTFGLHNLYALDLSHNKLRKFPYSALNSVRKSVSTLHLQHNSITNLSSMIFEGLSNLSTLVISHNRIQEIQEATFGALPKLRHLDLSHNPVHKWDYLAFKKLSNAIDYLNLADMGLMNVPPLGSHPATSMRTLNLSLNRIYKLDLARLSPHDKLVNLDLSHNRITELPNTVLFPLHDLKHLNLSHNDLSSLNDNHFKSLHKLETLVMHNLEQLHTIPNENDFWFLRNIRDLKIFKVLALTQLNMSKVLETLPPLRTLHIEFQGAKLLHRQLHSADFRFLRELHIYGNDIKSVDHNALRPLRGFRVRLKISETRLETFPSSILRTLTRINYLDLDLSGNLLHSLDAFDFTQPPVLNQHGTILNQMNLEGNLWKCDCRLQWLQEWLDYFRDNLSAEEFSRKVSGWTKTVCAQPSSLARKQLLQVDFKRMGCKNDGQRRKISPLSMIAIQTALAVMTLFGGGGSSH